jgi:hypothetical protein
LYGNNYIDNIQKAVVICLIIPTTFPVDAGSASKGNVVGIINADVTDDANEND